MMTTNESSVHLVNALTGERKKKLYTKENGIGKIAYTHHEETVVASSDKRNNHDLVYYCLYDNRYLRYFRGHSDRVSSISMCPTDDRFITGSVDKTVCMWDLSTATPTGKVMLPQFCDDPIVKFDESGIVFGVMSRDNKAKKQCLKLFDSRKYSVGPFDDIVPSLNLMETAIMKSNPSLTPPMLQKYFESSWTSFDFSADGNHILANTLTDVLLVLDGFRSDVEPLAISNRKNDSSLNLGACFSGNAKYVYTGNEENQVLIYDKSSGELLSALDGHASPVGCIKGNPRYDQIASGCTNTVLWIPSVSD